MCPDNKIQDIHCTEYIQEIELFLKTKSYTDLPRFCTHFFDILTKKQGYQRDDYLLDFRYQLLDKIQSIGTGSYQDVDDILVKHHIKKQEIAPLWIISSALTLGEINMVFSMLPDISKKRIIKQFIAKNDINQREIFKFNSTIENIRRMRNVVNHYEPIMPFLINEIKEKKIEDAQMIKTISFLSDVYNKNSLLSIDYSDIMTLVQENSYNAKKNKILSVIFDMINQK